MIDDGADHVTKVRFSLGLKLSFGLILIIGILFAGFNTFNVISQQRTRRAEVLNNTRALARVVAGALLGELPDREIHSPRFRTFAGNLLNSAIALNRDNRDVAFGVVVDTEDQVVVGIAKPRLTVFPGGKTYDKMGTILKEIAKARGRLDASVMRTRRFPLKYRDHSGTMRDRGMLMFGTSLQRLHDSTRRDLVINISVFVGTLLLLIIYSSLTLRHWVVSPIKAVAKAMTAVREGNLSTEINTRARDEIGVLANSYNYMVRGLREREKLKDAFNRYVSAQVYEKMKAGEITLTGENRNATVLFSDIRSFTSLSEQLSPPEVVAMLNEYFTEMVEIVFKYNGFLNKFIGDAIMAIYNAPLDQTEHELKAVRTAIEMNEALQRLNERREARGQFPIRIGIGLNTGPVVAGNIGHQQRLEYTVIGDAVNLAQRLESQTKAAGATILISEATYAPIAQAIDAVKLPAVKVKGKQEPVPMYAVRGLLPPASNSPELPPPSAAAPAPRADDPSPA